jgi:hypothetical protein
MHLQSGSIRILLFLGLFSGCGSSTTGSGSTGGTGGTDSSCKARWPASQSVSQGCCTDWGVDACGANLYCAAFDGRTQTTCYQERSRDDLSECTADVQCASGSCSTARNACRSSSGNHCTVAVGCADRADGTRQGCLGEPPTCLALLTSGSECGEGAECLSTSCVFPGSCSTFPNSQCSATHICPNATDVCSPDSSRHKVCQ